MSEDIQDDTPLLLQCGDVLTDVFGFLLPHQQHNLRATCRQATLWFDTAADTYHMIPMFVSGYGTKTRDLLDLDDDAAVLDAVDLDEGATHPGAVEGDKFDPRFESAPKCANDSDANLQAATPDEAPRSWRYAPVMLCRESIHMPNPRPPLIHTLCSTRIGTLFINLRCLDARLYESAKLRIQAPQSIVHQIPNVSCLTTEALQEEKSRSGPYSSCSGVRIDSLITFFGYGIHSLPPSSSAIESVENQNELAFEKYDEVAGRKLLISASFLQGLNARSVVFVEPERIGAIGERYLADSSITVAVFDGMRNVEHIGKSFLRDCYNLRYVNFGGLGEKLKPWIPSFTLSGCTQLRRVVFPSRYVHRDILRRDDVYRQSTDDFGDELGGIESQNGADGAPQRGNLMFSQITAIGDSFMERCPALSSIDLNGLGSVTSIGSGFLSFATGLATFVVPPNMNKVTTIGDRFLMHCSKLNSANFDNFSSALATVGACWLTNAENLTSVSYKGLNGLSKVGGLWMGRCPNLGPVVDLSGLYRLDSVGPRWLCETPALRRVIWPELSPMNDSVTPAEETDQKESAIGTTSASAATSQDPSSKKNSPSVVTAASSAFHLSFIGDFWLSGSGIEELLISPPHRFLLLRSIGNECLSKCPNLKRVELECCPCLTSIGAGFLAECPSLTSVSMIALPVLGTIGVDWLSGAVALRLLIFRPNLILIGQNYGHAACNQRQSSFPNRIELGQGWLDGTDTSFEGNAKDRSVLKKISNSCASGDDAIPDNRKGCHILTGYKFINYTRYGNSLSVSVSAISGFLSQSLRDVDPQQANTLRTSEGGNDEAVFCGKSNWEPKEGLAKAIKGAVAEAEAEEQERLRIIRDKKAKDSGKKELNVKSKVAPTSEETTAKEEAKEAKSEEEKKKRCSLM